MLEPGSGSARAGSRPADPARPHSGLVPSFFGPCAGRGAEAATRRHGARRAALTRGPACLVVRGSARAGGPPGTRGCCGCGRPFGRTRRGLPPLKMGGQIGSADRRVIGPRIGLRRWRPRQASDRSPRRLRSPLYPPIARGLPTDGPPAGPLARRGVRWRHSATRSELGAGGPASPARVTAICRGRP